MSRDGGRSCDRLLRVLVRWAGDAVTAQTLELAGDGALTPAQLRCLDFLTKRERCSVGELADGLAISDPAATKLVDRLEGKGLVARSGHAGDRRVVYVVVSAVGVGLVLRLGRRRDSLVAGAFGKLSARRLQTLARSLESLLICALDSPDIIRRVCLRCGRNHAPECVVNRAHILVTGEEIAWR